MKIVKTCRCFCIRAYSQCTEQGKQHKSMVAPPWQVIVLLVFNKLKEILSEFDFCEILTRKLLLMSQHVL